MNWQTSEPPHCPTCHCGIQCPACESKAQRIAELEAEKRGSVCAADPHGVHGTCEYWKAAMEEGRRQEARIAELEADNDRLRAELEEGK